LNPLGWVVTKLKIKNKKPQPPYRGTGPRPFKKKILNRMSYLSGHLEGVKKMIRDDKYCIDIIKQNEAILAAIKKVNQIILGNHLNTCVTEAIKGKNKKERKRKIKEPLAIYKNSKK